MKNMEEIRTGNFGGGCRVYQYSCISSATRAKPGRIARPILPQSINSHLFYIFLSLRDTLKIFVRTQLKNYWMDRTEILHSWKIWTKSDLKATIIPKSVRSCRENLVKNIEYKIS